jgi:regulator of protease activity HflC (stomatin/prohibitin superfamily)
MTKKPTKAVATAAPAYITDEPPSEDKLKIIRERMRETRDREARIKDLQSVLADETRSLADLKNVVLPELFAQAGIDNLGLPAEGNNAAYDFKLRKYTHASISADWEDEKRAEAFRVLEQNGGKDLIKTEIYAFIPAGPKSRALTKQATAALKKLGIVPEVENAVQWNTLTAFIKEATEKRGLILPLEKLGAVQGMIVEWKERKTDGTSKEENRTGRDGTATRPEGTTRNKSY